MSLQSHRPYLKTLSDTLAQLEADPVETLENAHLKTILRERIDLLEHAQELRSDSLMNQFGIDCKDTL